MSSQDPIVNRLLQQKNQIARMLMPGSKRSLGSQTSWDFSPVAPDFGGKKFEMAAQKMQVLKKENLGEARSERTINMANTIQAKFKDAHTMLHLSGAGRKENSFWSEVEKVFPNQSAGRVETSTESDGLLRRGSIIQQFSAFPKPGQSLESFKEQTPRNPVMRKVDTSLPKRANLSPKDRLFSRVQELTAGQKEKKNIEQANVEKPVAISSPALSENVQRQVEQVSPPPSESAPQQAAVQDLAPSADENIQRRVEQVSPPVPKQTVQRKTEQAAPLTLRDSTVKSSQPDSNEIVQRKIEMPAPPVPRESSAKISQPDSNEVAQRKVEQLSALEPHDSNAESLPPVPSENVQRQVEQTLPSALLGFTPESQKQESPNVSKPELPLARPAQKLTADTLRLPVALPLKKSDNLDISTIVKPAMPVAQLKISPTPVVQPVERPDSIGQVVQRQPETREPQQKQESPNVTKPELPLKKSDNLDISAIVKPAMPVAQLKISPMPVVQPVERPDSIGQVVQRQPETPAPSGKFILDSAPESAAKVVGQQAEMPLRKHLERKQSAFGGLSLEVGRIRPVAAARNILQLKNNPIQRHLSVPKKEITFDALPSVKLPSTLRAQPESFSLHTPAFSPDARAVASAPAPMALAKMRASTALPIQRAALQMPVAQLTPAKPVENSTASQALVPQSATQNVIQRALVEQDDPQHIQYPPTQDAASAGSVNIIGLAEKIFPLVKQLLLIEFERTGSRSR